MKNISSKVKKDSHVYRPGASAGPDGKAIAPPQNRTGLPDTLKSGVESLSGLSLDDVRVHYNSSKPAQLQALAYTQGSGIHVAPGQERHLPHEAWHVVQQKQGRVRPTFQLKGAQINDDTALEREADRMGSKATRTPQPMKFEKTSTPVPHSTNLPIQRKIGAEIEVPGVFLTYDKEKPASQGESVGSIVPGIITEIHLEGPKNGTATLEFATGLHGQYPPEHPLSLAFQVGYLATWIEIAKLREKTYLKDMPLAALDENWQDVNDDNGPMVDVDNTDAKAGAFQINVSPTKTTASTFQDIFDTMHTVSHDSGTLTKQEEPVNEALKNSKTFALNLYNNIINLLGEQIHPKTVPGILKSTIKALTSVPRVLYFNYLKGFEGYGSPTKDIIDKNILELLPRANLQELWEKTLATPEAVSLDVDINTIFPTVLRDALEATEFPELQEGWALGEDMGRQEEIIDLLKEQNRLVNLEIGTMPVEEKFQRLQEILSKIGEYQFLGEVVEGPNIIHAMDLRNEIHTEILDVLAGRKILVKNRKVKTEQAPSVLKGTTSSLLPVNEEEGPAGVFEIRNPFNHLIPLSDWEQAVATYEEMLGVKGVRY